MGYPPVGRVNRAEVVLESALQLTGKVPFENRHMDDDRCFLQLTRPPNTWSLGLLPLGMKSACRRMNLRTLQDHSRVQVAEPFLILYQNKMAGIRGRRDLDVHARQLMKGIIGVQ